MIFWAVFAAMAVFGVKYYTSVQMRQLERRMSSVKDELHSAKDKLQSAQEGQTEANTEEDAVVERGVRMREMIADIQDRLAAREEVPEE
jgi:predicted  nucleic acid-binding Zn-ribbon protein